MAKIQDIDIPHLEFAEAAAPGTPASGIVRIYAKTDGKLYIKDDAGTETDLTDTGAAGNAYSATTVRRTSAQNVSGSGTLTSISWESETEDTDGAWAIGTPTQIVVPAGLNGRKVVVTAHVQWTASSSGTYRGLYLKHNAAFPGADLRYGVGAGLSVFQNFTSYPITVATGDTFEAQMRADTTGIGAAASGSTFMSMHTVD